jgi:hypothetical protein
LLRRTGAFLRTLCESCDRRRCRVAETTPVSSGPEVEPEARLQGDGAGGGGPGELEGSRLVESMLDNLPAWAFLALAIAALYMVWATLVIVEKYVGDLPTFIP